MTLSDFAAELNRVGLTVPLITLKSVTAAGKLGEVRLDGAGNRQFTTDHLRRAVVYFSTPRVRGRKPRTERVQPVLA